MNIGRRKSLSLGTDGILRIFLLFTIPSVLSMLAQTTATLIDSVFIGRFVGPEGLAGITLFMPVFLLIIGFSSMIAIGGVTLAGIHMGSSENSIANNYFNVTIFMVVVFCILSTAATWLLADVDFLMRRLGLRRRSALLTSEYARVLTWFYVPFLVNFAFSLFVKLSGRPSIVVIANVGGTVINIVLDWLLVARMGMGMAGAALATGIAQTFPCIVLLFVIRSRTPWHFKWPRFHGQHVGALLFNGASEFLSMASLAIAGFAYNWAILRRMGEDGVAAYGIAAVVAEFALMLFYGIAEAIQSPVSFNFGADLKDRVTTLRRLGSGAAVGISVVLLPVVFFGGGSIANLFTSPGPATRDAAVILQFFALSFIGMGINIVATSYYTAINQPVISAVLAVLRGLVGIVIGLLIFPSLIPENGLWIPLIFTELLTLVLVIVLYSCRPLGFRTGGKTIPASANGSPGSGGAALP